MAFWYARDEEGCATARAEYVFSAKKPMKLSDEAGKMYFTGYGASRDACVHYAERILASKDMRLEPGEGPYRLEPLRRWKPKEG